MPDNPENEFPKVPPFISPGDSEYDRENPGKQSAHVVQPPRTPAKNGTNLTQLGTFSSLVLLISVISLGAAMVSGAWFAYSVLSSEPNNEDKAPSAQTIQPQVDAPPNTTEDQKDPSKKDNERGNVFSKVIVIGLAYAVGWVFGAFGIRALGNLILPYSIRAYAWVTLGGLIILHILIISRLYKQEYHFLNYVKYLSLFGAGMIALIGLHLLLEKHDLRPFGVLILITSMGHLYFIVYHYIFVPDVNYAKVWGDLIFFFVTTIVSLLMLAHFGMLNGWRNFMDRTFTPIDNPFVSPE